MAPLHQGLERPYYLPKPWKRFDPCDDVLLEGETVRFEPRSCMSHVHLVQQQTSCLLEIRTPALVRLPTPYRAHVSDEVPELFNIGIFQPENWPNGGIVRGAKWARESAETIQMGGRMSLHVEHV